MKLPTLNTPTYKTVLPSIGSVEYRPYLVKEEKILLMSLESKNLDEVISSMTRVMEACVIKPKINFSKLPYYEAEFLFLKIRSKSAGEVIDLQTRHVDGLNSKGEECKHIHTLEVNLETLTIPGLDKKDKIVKLNDTVGLELRVPSLSEFYHLMSEEDNEDKAINLLSTVISKIFDGEDVYDTSEVDHEEMVSFIENLTSKQCEMISDFFTKIPNLKIEIPYKCSGCGSDEKITIEGVQSFFR